MHIHRTRTHTYIGLYVRERSIGALGAGMGGQDMGRKGMCENGRGVEAGGVEAWGLRRRHNLKTYR